MAVIEQGKPTAWEEGDVIFVGEALHAFVMANGLLDGCIFVSQPVPLFHTTV